MHGTSVMIVDDEPQTRRVLRTALISHGFEVSDARSGEEALERLRTDKDPHVILLDLNMPGMGGMETCRLIRERSEIPIIVVSAAQSEPEKVEALDAGADDYITKPASIEEMVARIRAVSRRPSLGRRSPLLVLGTVEINLETHEVRRDGKVEHLTSKEFQVLHFLLSHAGQIVSHRRLLQAAWGPDYGDEVQYLRVFINQLRKKIEPDPSHPRYILTEPSSGYRFVRSSDA
jgi:two-component system KDP operon response regulator KdpE